MNKVLSIYNKLFVLWVVLGGLAAYFYPHVFIPLKKYMELFFAITMLGVGMVLNPADFVNIFKNIKVVIIGVLAQFSIMPVGAFLVSKIFMLSKEFSLGLILFSPATQPTRGF